MIKNHPDEIDKRPMPLEGIRILEYGVFHAGPGASAILGDLGADVIKIEQGHGDPERFWIYTGGADFSMPNGVSIWFEISNRGKKGICLDIEKEKGREIFIHLLKEADVFLTNLRKSTKANLGIDYTNISRINPRIIYAGVSGYGPEGPLDDFGAYDPMGQARSGMMFATGSEEPALINLAVLDQAAAIAASHGILTALFFRERHGKGQEVHVSLYSTAIWLMYANMVIIGGLSIDPNLDWQRSKNSPLRNRFCCKDGKWFVGVHHPEGKYWPTLCQATGQSQLLDDPRFRDESSRLLHCPELMAIFDKVFATRTRDEWVDILTDHGLMYGPVQRNIDIFSDPQALANDYLVDFEHPVMGKMKFPGYPIHFSECSAETRRTSPAVGEHTDQVLKKMGCADTEIDVLEKEGIIWRLK